MKRIFNRPLAHGKFEVWNEKPDFEVNHVIQVHGCEISSTQTLPSEADGIISSWEEFKFPLAIKTADCLPIVIEGKKGIVFIHAGWRGLRDGILNKSEIVIIEPTEAFIGPGIGKCCFEVSEDFRNYFEAHFFHLFENKLFFDLKAEAKKQLQKQFSSLKITDSEVCTMCSSEFHSYRRNKTVSRNWNIYLKG